ncbi:branched-chain amino acid ABC transporter permease [Arthrobacter sp. BE255]|uniref:branched-chain amino acid ABC transporter permease n=1 Tax=Arthrobacter sp. BE255 TaxID=2817721 RepID=UPI00285A0B32|nr:branched-chain amino acid ABC transporter permease [Arthrobacter sp. BE255]MDR7159131.1 branched-chain amino acid transport system permease protein [Arthrobacter sp. BE255]
MTIVWAGLSLGAVYALVALCLNITYSNTGIFNFAQPHFLMVGAFAGYELQNRWGVPLPLVLLGCAIIGGLVGYVEERLAIRTLGGSRGHTVLVTIIGFAVVLEGFIIVAWSTDPYTFKFMESAQALDLLGGRVLPIDLVLIALAFSLMILLVMIQRTKWGLAGSAATMDSDVARLRGINVERVTTGAFIAAGALAGAIGPLVGSKIGIVHSMGNNLVVLAFAALAVGGFGSYVGCILGGFITGLLQLATTYLFGNDLPLIILLAFLLVTLLLRPTGVLGARSLRSV